MNYPKQMIIGGQTIGVEILDTPLYQFYECPKCTMWKNKDESERAYRFHVPYGTKQPCPACGCERVQPVDNTYVLGQYLVRENRIKNWHSTDASLQQVCETSFVHETIEAIDSIMDLKLNHTQITTLASSLYQAFNTGGVNFGTC
jgi:hypothetical protein